MSKRLLLLIIIALLVAAGATFLLLRRPSTQTPETNGTVTNQATVNTSASANVNREKTKAEQEREQATALALLFTERFGSYSTDTLSTIVSELSAFLTPAGTTQAQEVIRQQQAKYGTSAVGVTTKALTTNFTTYAAGASATVFVQAQREERIVGNAPTQTTQTLKLDLVKQGEQWKVNRAAWQ